MTNERAITIDNSNEKTFSDLDVVSKSSIGHSASDTAEGMFAYYCNGINLLLINMHFILEIKLNFCSL
jgi:spore coat polysaccharide biosynthesis predicted glycosyltransferase SpsG